MVYNICVPGGDTKRIYLHTVGLRPKAGGHKLLYEKGGTDLK